MIHRGLFRLDSLVIHTSSMGLIELKHDFFPLEERSLADSRALTGVFGSEFGILLDLVFCPLKLRHGLRSLCRSYSIPPLMLLVYCSIFFSLGSMSVPGKTPYDAGRVISFFCGPSEQNLQSTISELRRVSSAASKKRVAIDITRYSPVNSMSLSDNDLKHQRPRGSFGRYSAAC